MKRMINSLLKKLVPVAIALHIQVKSTYFKKGAKDKELPYLLFSFWMDNFHQYEVISRACEMGLPAWNGEQFEIVSPTASYLIIAEWSSQAQKTGISVYCDENLTAKIRNRGWSWSRPGEHQGGQV